MRTSIQLVRFEPYFPTPYDELAVFSAAPTPAPYAAKPDLGGGGCAWR